MTSERDAVVRWLRPQAPHLADAIERGDHRPRVFSRNSGIWPCGHPRTPDNIWHVGKAGVRCRTCRMRAAADRAQARGAAHS